MTNFEKILAETTKLDVAEALCACHAQLGQCDKCPALELCNQKGDQDDVGCVDVWLEWLDMEAEEDGRTAFS